MLVTSIFSFSHEVFKRHLSKLLKLRTASVKGWLLTTQEILDSLKLKEFVDDILINVIKNMEVTFGNRNIGKGEMLVTSVFQGAFSKVI